MTVRRERQERKDLGSVIVFRESTATSVSTRVGVIMMSHITSSSFLHMNRPKANGLNSDHQVTNDNITHQTTIRNHSTKHSPNINSQTGVNYNMHSGGSGMASSASSGVTKKSALKRSKSYKEHDYSNSNENYWSALNEFKSADTRMFLVRAMKETNSLSANQLMEVVKIIFNKALDSSTHAASMTRMSLAITENERSRKIFLESLTSCCREWFLEKSQEVPSSRPSEHHSWPSYVAFLRELYTGLKSKQRRVKLAFHNESNHEDHNEPQASYLQKYSRCVANLLFESCLKLIKGLSKSRNISLDVEIVTSVLRCAGRSLEDEKNGKMSQIMDGMREVLLSPQTEQFSSLTKKSLLETIELRSSGWDFTQNQQVYYFPYTSPDCNP